MAVILRQRRDTTANWTTNNPVIPDGQLCFDITNNTFRIGNGTDNYADLAIQSGVAGNDGADGLDGTLSGLLGSDLSMNGFSIGNAEFTGSITEQVATMPALALDPSNGTIQSKTLASDETWTDSLTTGQSMVIHVTNAGYSITYPTITWVTVTPPTLTAVDALVFYKIGATLFGAYIGSVGA